MNVVILQGKLSRPAEQRELPSGDHLVAYEVTIPAADGKADSVPVVWATDAERALLDKGEEVVVTGRVRRRFFRAGGVTQSRTEVVADAVVVATDTRRVRKVIAAAVAAAGAG